MQYVILALCAILGYLLGSLNMSVIVGKCMGVDVRKHGSGNAGATNTLRTLGKRAAVIVSLGDLIKPMIAIALSGLLTNWLLPGDVTMNKYAQYLAALGAVLGHNFPLYFGFRGGKGILATLGALLLLDWKIALILAAIGILVIAVTSYVSLGSMTSAILYPVFVIAANLSNHQPYTKAYILFSIVIALLALFQHRTNIKRLLEGNESSLYQKKKKEE